MAAAIAILAALVPVTRERLNRFTQLTGLFVTETNARLVVDHFSALRRWRLIALVAAVPLTIVTDDPFYLILGWCAVCVFRDVLPPAGAPRAHEGVAPYRGAWLLSVAGAVVAVGSSASEHGFTAARLAHVVVAVVVVVTVELAARAPGAGPSPGVPDDVVRAERAVHGWSARTLYLGGAAIVLSGALLTPAQPARPDLPEYSMPLSFPEERARFTTVDEYTGPTCAWIDQMDAPCRWWLVNEQPFPQAAPYVVGKGGAPRLAPFVPAPGKEAVVYLDRHERRMVYQDGEGVHDLTGVLADTEVPTPTFARQNRYVALSRNGARITDTRDWGTVSIPDARKVHDLNESGIVATTASRVLVLDHRGKERMSLPLRKLGKDAPEDTYHLRRDGDRFVVIRGPEGRVETFDPETGERLSVVTPTFPGEDFLDVGLGWSKQGPFVVRGYASEREYYLDLTGGDLWRRKR
ncbi:hypothetical protein [Streptosporangium sp. NPDC023615]|uniref:hypothetical protein n=1 Tax=Streptosporangium sp. NPDC023615 TaxID=3154794 RepID=UPI003446809A